MDTKQVIILAISGIVSFLLAAVFGKWLIPELTRLRFGQTILEEGPQWHQKKQGTPTMGGVIFILATALTSILTILVCHFGLHIPLIGGSNFSTVRLLGALLLPILCGVIGFADDYIKVVKKRNLGLTAPQKLLAQLIVSLAFAVAM